MDKIIKNSEEIDLSGTDIMRMTDSKTSIMSYEMLKNYNSIDTVLGRYESVVILYETRRNFGHWVVLFKVSETTLEFFDSYGLSVDEELAFDKGYNKRIHKGQEVPHLSHLLNESNYNVISNKKQLQSNLEDINTCGRYCVLRVILRHITLKEFNDLLINNKHYNPDFWVSALTYLK